MLKVVANLSWLLAEKGLRTVLGLFVTALTARHLGPAQFGLYSIAVTVASVLSSVVPVGLSTLLVQRMLETPQRVGSTLSAGLAITAVASVVAWGGVSLLSPMVLPEGWPVLLVVAISAFARPADVMRFYFESRMQVRPLMISDGIVLISFTIVRVFITIFDASVLLFAIVYVVETLVSSAIVVVLYRASVGAANLENLERAEVKALLRAASPLIAAAVCVSVYTKVDQFLVTQLLGLDQAGGYVAATRISESLNSIPIFIAATTFPVALAAKERGGIAEFDRVISRILAAGCAFSIGVAAAISVGAETIVRTVYGIQFSDAAQILAIHVWTSVFVMLGTIGSRWYVSNGLQRLILTRALVGGGVSIVMNAALIPILGSSGAALAAVISFAASGYLLDALWPKTRGLFRLKSRAIFGLPKNVIMEVQKLRGKH
jgi:O-antigen/teichoic acid export membrane protein